MHGSRLAIDWVQRNTGGKLRMSWIRTEKMKAFKETVLGLLLWLSLVAVPANIAYWVKHRQTDALLEAGLFVLIGGVCFLFTSDRFVLLFATLLALMLFTMFESVLHRTLKAVPVILLCGVLAYLLIRWKAKSLK
jgi:hypothetical protein